MASLGKLTLDLVAETGGFTKGMTKAERRSAKFKQNVGRQMQDMQHRAKLAGLAVAGVSVAVLKLSTDTLQAQENLGDLAKQLGANVTKLTALQYAAEQNGSSAENLASGLQVLQKRLGDVAVKGSGPAKQALDALGLSLDDLAGKDPTKQFRTISQAMQGVEDQSKRNSIASALFSRANQNLVTTLGLTSSELGTLTAQADALGITLSKDQVQAAAQADAAIRDLKFSFKGAANTIASDLAPQIQHIAEDLTTFIQKAQDNGQIKSFFTGLVGGAKAVVTHVKELAKWLVISKAAMTGAKIGARWGLPGLGIGGLTGAGAGLAFFEYVDSFASNAAAANGAAIDGLGNLAKLEAKENKLIARLDRLKDQRGHDVSDAYQKRTLEPEIDKAQQELRKVEERIRQEKRAQAANRSAQKAAADAQGNIDPAGNTSAPGGGGGSAPTKPTMQMVNVPDRPDVKTWGEANREIVSGLRDRYAAGRSLTAGYQRYQVQQIQATHERQREAIQQTVAGQTEAQRLLSENAAREAQQIEQINGKQVSAFSNAVRSGAEQMQQSFANFLINPLQDGFAGLLQSFSKMVQQMLAQLVAVRAMKALVGTDFSNGGKLGGLLGAAASAFIGGAGAGGGLSSAAGSGAGGMAYAAGGIVHGPGTATSDSIPARLSNGEGVLTAKAVGRVGADFVHALNAGRGYAQGGVVGRGPRMPQGGGPGTIVNIENHTDAKAKAKSSKNSAGQDVVTVMIKKAAQDVRKGGELGQAVLQATNASRRLSG